MKLIIYYFAVIYIQCSLGDPVIRYYKPSKPLSMKDVLRYVMDTSKVLEELAKEHLWLLSIITGTNNWNDLLGDGKPSWRKERVAEDPSKGVIEDSERHDDEEEAESQESMIDGKPQASHISDVETKELDSTFQAQEGAVVAEKVDTDPIKATEMLELTSRTTQDNTNNLHNHLENSLNNEPRHNKISNNDKPVVNPKMGYTTDIGHGHHPDPALNYLAWKDKPIHHQVDPYGKQIKDSDKSHTDSPKPENPPVLNTQESDLVFSPLPIKQHKVDVAAKRAPSKVPPRAKLSPSPNPLALLNKVPHQNKEETNTLPEGRYNPLALVSSLMNDMYDDVDNTDPILAESNLNPDIRHVHPVEANKDPLAYPVQYYKPNALPDKHSKRIFHPAHHSRLEVNDVGW